MAIKKKSKKKSTKAKKSAARKATPTRMRALKAATAKKPAKKTAASNKATATRKSSKKTATGKTTKIVDKQNRFRRERAGSAFSRETPGTSSGEQSGDLQGLSNIESVDSESVDELLEEGNAFEAGVVSGVEDSGERGVKEVRTREVPEDDVPEEYLDEE